MKKVFKRNPEVSLSELFILDKAVKLIKNKLYITKLSETKMTIGERNTDIFRTECILYVIINFIKNIPPLSTC